MRQTRYPDYVRAFRPKGTAVRLRNGRYTVFRATSKTVPGKKHPTPVIGELIGWIDSSGFHPQQKRTVDFSCACVCEYGFTNLLLGKEDAFVAKKKGTLKEEDARLVYRSLIVSLSPSSYLKLKVNLLSREEIAAKYPVNVARVLGSMASSVGMPEEQTRLLFTLVGIHEPGGEFRTLQADADVRRILSVYGIDTEVLRNGIAL